MKNTAPGGAVGWGHATLLVASFVITVVAAGHGVAPIGLILVFGWNIQWLIPVLLAWLGMGTVVFGRVRTDTVGRRLERLGGLVCLGSWAWFVARSEAPAFTLLSSIPFLATSILWVVRTWDVSGGRD
jgi:hypothetical protein